MSEKEGEKIAEENLAKATKAAVGSLDDPNRKNKEEEGQGRASVAQVLSGEHDKTSEETENIISTKVESIEDLFGKSDKQALADAMDKAGAKKPQTKAEKQKDLNRKTLESLATAGATQQTAEVQKDHD